MCVKAGNGESEQAVFARTLIAGIKKRVHHRSKPGQLISTIDSEMSSTIP